MSRMNEQQKMELLLKYKNIVEIVYYDVGHASTNGLSLLEPKMYPCCESIVKPNETSQNCEHHKFTMYNHSKSYTHKFYEYMEDFEMTIPENELQDLLKCYKYLKAFMKKNNIETVEDFFEIVKITLDFF